MSVTSRDGIMTINTRRIVVAGVLGAISIVLAVTRWGYITVPNVVQDATIMHVTVIIGAVLEGPLVGAAVGGIFGVSSLILDTSGLFKNPIISVLPRIIIGLTAWAAYKGLAKLNRDVAAVVAAIVGTLTNTILVVGLLIAFGSIPVTVIPLIIPQALAELALAAVLTPIVVRAVDVVRSGLTTAVEKGPRDKSSF